MNGFEVGWDWIFGCLLLTVAIGVFIMFTNKSQNWRKRNPETEDYYKILKARYATGEITKAEFKRLKKELQD